MQTVDSVVKNLEERIEKIIFSNQNEALPMVQELLEISLKENHPYGILKGNNMLGILCSEKGKISDALNHYSIAMSYTYQDDLNQQRPVLLNNIGSAQVVSGNYLDAIETLSNALNYIYENEIRVDMVFSILLNIADAYLGIQQPEEAIEYLNDAMDKHDETDLEGIAVLLSTYAAAYIDLKDQTKAFDYILLCEEAAENANYSVMFSLVAYYKAKYFELIGAYKDVEVFYERALHMQLEGDKYYHFSKIALDFFKYLIGRQKYEQAIPYIKQSITIAKQQGWEWVYLDYYRVLSECYRRLNNFPMAFESVSDYFNEVSAIKNKKSSQYFNWFKTQEKILKMDIKNRSLSNTIDSLKKMNEILSKINSANDNYTLIETVYRELKILFDLDAFALGLFNDEKKLIQYLAKYENGISLGSSHIKYDNLKSFSEWVRKNNKPIIIKDIDDLGYMGKNYPGLEVTLNDVSRFGTYSRSIIIWPLFIDQTSIGLINFQSVHKNAFSQYDIELIEMLSSHIAIAISNFEQKNQLSILVEKLNKMSFIDNLTGVYNRQALNEYLPKLYQKAIDDQSHLVFAMLDLDNFKVLNDTSGHQKGDECLLAFANLLKEVVGELGYAYRYGGDEFSLLFIGIDLEVVESMLDEIILRSQTFYEYEDSYNITASIGAVFVENGNCSNLSMISFINFADNALYIAKHEGKNNMQKVII